MTDICMAIIDLENGSLLEPFSLGLNNLSWNIFNPVAIQSLFPKILWYTGSWFMQASAPHPLSMYIWQGRAGLDQSARYVYHRHCLWSFQGSNVIRKIATILSRPQCLYIRQQHLLSKQMNLRDSSANIGKTSNLSNNDNCDCRYIS